MSDHAEPIDCLIVGAGPAGLTAAIYACRFRLSVTVIDDGQSRAAQIPCTRNHAGFPDGIAGIDLIERMRTQAMRFGAAIRSGRVLTIEVQAGAFAVRTADEMVMARAVILATGVSNHRPDMDDALHALALRRGLLRYCPVCDGFEVTDTTVGVIGDGANALKEAEFLRAYTKSVTVIAPAGEAGFDHAQRTNLATMEVAIIPGSPRDFRLEHARLSFTVDDRRLTFDTIYPALGSTARSSLAANLGAKLTNEGCIETDAHQRTSVPGLYAAGDVVIGLDQISHAMGEAGVAATTVRNDLAARVRRLR